MNMPSFYQADLFRALVNSGKVSLHVIFLQRIPAERAKLGWNDDLSGFDYEFLDARAPIFDAIRKARRSRGGIHIVGGLWAGSVIESVLLTLKVSGAEYFIYSEAPDPRQPIPSWEKIVLLKAGKHIINGAKGILSVSHFARDYFRLYGAPDSKIHPFGYFRSLPPTLKVRPLKKKKERIDVIFVGQFVHRKGVDILLSAIEPLMRTRNNLFLQLVGAGEEEIRYRSWVAEKNLTRQITFEGTLSPHKVVGRISRADVLVLPSRWDGWGIVVNEAFMASVPVIVSDMCGASDVVKDGINGFVFSSENIQELTRKLDGLTSNSQLRLRMKTRASKTGLMLEAETAAQYLLAVINGRWNQDDLTARTYPWLAKVDRH
jgi:glycosyltransferase involved in cell wall biosynthesis